MLSTRAARCALLLSVVSWSVLLSIPHVHAQAPFTVSVSPGRIVLGTKSGLSDRFGVTVIAGHLFNGTVTFAVSGVPTGVTAVFQDWGTYLAPLSIFTTYLEVTSSLNATLGDHTLTVSATSQHDSLFYIASSQVHLLIQENGQPRPLLEENATRTTPPSPMGQEYVISLTILALATGAALGSVATYIFIRERTQPRRGRELSHTSQ